MKTLLLFISAIGLTLMSFGQTVTFDDYKKRADACFNKAELFLLPGQWTQLPSKAIPSGLGSYPNNLIDDLK